MKTLTTILIALVLLLPLGGCGTDTDLSASRFACDAAHGCPSGFSCCPDGFCRPAGDTSCEPAGSGLECDGTSCVDPGTGLEWQQSPPDIALTWQEAKDTCEQAGWRLPTISELRTIIVGCEALDLCGVTDECTSWQHCQGTTCTAQCDVYMGPGLDGCYRPEGLAGLCANRWSATEVSDQEDSIFVVAVMIGRIGMAKMDAKSWYRCVR